MSILRADANMKMLVELYAFNHRIADSENLWTLCECAYERGVAEGIKQMGEAANNVLDSVIAKRN